MADVQLNWTGTISQTYKVEYKKDVDVTWVTAINNLTSTTFTIAGLDPNTLYNFRVTATCDSGDVASPTIISHTTEATTTIWIEDAFVCQQTDPLVIGDTFTGFSSPQGVFYDQPSGRFYIVELDDVNGNIWYFNPATFTGTADRVYVPGSLLSGTTNYTQGYDFSPTLRKIFVAGEYNGGVMVYNIATNTIDTITQGTDGSFARLLCRLINGNLYLSNKFDNTLAIIDPVTQTVSSVLNVNLIPGNTSNQYFNNSYNMYGVNGEIWVCASGFRATNGSIARYNSTFTSFLGEITIPSVASPGGSWPGFWQAQFFDEEKQKFYLSDVGSRKITVVDTTTNSVIEQIDMGNNEGKQWGLVSWNLNTLTGDLYANKQSSDTPGGTSIIKFYVVDRDNYEYKSFFKNMSTSGLRLREGTNEFWAANAGVTGWAVPNTGWNTDGLIFKYTS